LATEEVFLRKKIPFRSFEVIKRNEKTLGELFCFFILETILLGRSLNVNPFDQPSVELIKEETKKICEEAIKSTGASSMKEMGKVMGELKSKHADTLDFSKVSGIIKGLLN